MNSLSKQEDLRVRRTQKLLWEALLALMDEHDFETITVKDICDRAMVHRTTFYKHYQDKYDLLMRGMRQMHTSLKEEAHIPSDGAPSDVATWHFQLIFKHVARYEHFYRLMLCGDGLGMFYSMMQRYLVERNQERLQQLQEAGLTFAQPLPFLAHFSAGALIGIVTWWLENDMAYSSEQMAHYMKAVMFEGVFHRPDKIKKMEV
jgi:AcrR family transcriptional regulator